MKRSDMLKAMNETFKNSYRGRVYEEVNDLILAKMESLGMLPPIFLKEGSLGAYPVNIWEDASPTTEPEAK